MASILLKDIVKKYENNVIAVDHFHLEIKDKEFVVLVGPSGCGKSTVLRMIAGLEGITQGELEMDGQRVNGISPKDRDVAMVFQNYALYPHKNVYENMAFGLKMRKVDKRRIEAIVYETAKQLQIEDLLRRKPSQLSGGQRQRVALGRAMVRKPRVFLLDEPLSNLDAKLRTEMRLQISRLHRQLQTTFVYVTHDQVEAMTMADRIVVMDRGRIQQVGTPKEIYEQPANLFVAKFVGSPEINLLPLSLLSVAEACDEQNRWVVAVRPEGVLLNPEDREGLLPLGRACIEWIEEMGAEAYAYLVFEGHRLTARISSPSIFKTGETVAVNFSRERLLFYRDGRITKSKF